MCVGEGGGISADLIVPFLIFLVFLGLTVYNSLKYFKEKDKTMKRRIKIIFFTTITTVVFLVFLLIGMTPLLC